MPRFIAYKGTTEENKFVVGHFFAVDHEAAYDKALSMYPKQDYEFLTVEEKVRCDKFSRLVTASENLVAFAEASQCASAAKYANLLALIDDMKKVLEEK